MQKNSKKLASILFFTIFFCVYFLSFSSLSLTIASETNGTIDSTYKYAWSNYSGWINFGSTNSNIQITDSGITGYLWNENYGWINMSPTYGGVVIASNGSLSGYAWGENTGWINFSGASINCSGEFTGTATGDIVETITFTCTNCSVITDYRPSDCRDGDDGGGGGSGPGSYCGDGKCEPDINETCINCPQDCGPCIPVCGNGACEPPKEDCENCPEDCGPCLLPPVCGDGLCEPDKDETCINCPNDCGPCIPVCGDGDCNGNETCLTCSKDCGICLPVCGDGDCNGNETCLTCSKDCGECKELPFCGDGFCKDNENCQNCPQDCGQCQAFPVCGDGVCEGNETCKNCPKDCGGCKITQSFCGDKKCEGDETCKNCPKDCGECKTIIPNIPPIVPFSPIDITTKTITTVSLVTVITATAFASPFTIPELFMIPARLLGILLVAFGWKKRNPPWGVVYDSVTKQPLDPAYVILKDPKGKDISSAITDLDGRYGFLADPGFYFMTSNKTNYLFPSQKLAGKRKDELYDNLYFGEQFEIKKDEIVTRNIPLDPIKFDWNEYAKQNKSLTKFYSRWDSLLRKISDVLYYIGFFIAIIAFFAAPYPYNSIILGLYIFLLILKIFGVKAKPYGSVFDINDNSPLAFAILRIFDPTSDREISHKITDKFGRYFCLVPKGKYYIKIEKKNLDGSYSLIYTSSIIDTSKKGIIQQKFKVSTKNIINNTPVPPPPPAPTQDETNKENFSRDKNFTDNFYEK
jgi:hypothetical protein